MIIIGKYTNSMDDTLYTSILVKFLTRCGLLFNFMIFLSLFIIEPAHAAEFAQKYFPSIIYVL